MFPDAYWQEKKENYIYLHVKYVPRRTRAFHLIRLSCAHTATKETPFVCTITRMAFRPNVFLNIYWPENITIYMQNEFPGSAE